MDLQLIRVMRSAGSSNRMKEAIIYFLAITLAEIVTTIFVQPLWGLMCHIILLVTIIVHSAFTRDENMRALVLSLALVPLVRIISLSMPLANVPQIWWYPIVYTPLFAAGLMVMRILGYSAGNVGLNGRHLRIQFVVALSGFAFGVMEFLILAPESTGAEVSWEGLWLRALIFFACTGFVEEFIFRGVMQQTALKAFTEWRGIVFVSAIFAIVHIIHYTEVGLVRVLLDVVFVFAVAMFFSWVVKRTGSLFGVTLAHGLTNSLLYLIVPLLIQTN